MADARAQRAAADRHRSMGKTAYSAVQAHEAQGEGGSECIRDGLSGHSGPGACARSFAAEAAPTRGATAVGRVQADGPYAIPRGFHPPYGADRCRWMTLFSSTKRLRPHKNANLSMHLGRPVGATSFAKRCAAPPKASRAELAPTSKHVPIQPGWRGHLPHLHSFRFTAPTKRLPWPMAQATRWLRLRSQASTGYCLFQAV